MTKLLSLYLYSEIPIFSWLVANYLVQTLTCFKHVRFSMFVSRLQIISWTCIKWYSTYSRFIKIEFGVRQGSVLAPSLFAAYIDDVVSRLSLSQRYFIILYADDILMISPSVSELQNIVSICERELSQMSNVNLYSALSSKPLMH